MKRVLTAIVLVTILITQFVSGESIINIWPKPVSVTQGTSNVAVITNPNKFAFATGNVPSGEAQQILESAIDRYRSLIFYKSLTARDSSPLCSRSDYTCVSGVQFNFEKGSTGDDLDLDMDERYAIGMKIGDKSVTISCYSVWGALRALETLSQIILIEDQQLDQSNPYYTFSLELPLTIADEPRFKWRGFMIDTSRHYLPVAKIISIIKALSYYKFNVLHWHVVDAQSFPLVVPTAPELSKKGAYSPKAVYTTDDVDVIVKTAKLHGIRVIHEYDVPGHAASWGYGYPEITAKCPSYVHNINNIPLDPTNEKTYEILEAIISTAAAHVPDRFMHFGGDELVMGCWKEDPNISKFMKQQGWTDYNQLLGYFTSRLHVIYSKYDRTMIAWEELLLEHGKDFKLPNATIVQSWRSKLALAQIVFAGHRGLLSAGWYLDRQVPGNSTHYAWVDTWQDFYQNDPTSGMGFTPQQEKLVLGGEACMWAEQVDITNYDSRVFPRVLAVAERLWSVAANTSNIAEAQVRLAFSRCNVLVRRGIRAGPVIPDYCDATEQFY